MSRWADALARGSLWLAAACLLAIAAVQGWQVWARYVLNDSPGWTEPVALLLMNTAMICGAAVGVRRESHFSFNLLVDAVGARAQRVLRSVAHLIAFGVGILLAWGGAVLYAAEADVAMAGAAIPEGARFLPLCLGGGLIALFALERLLQAWRPEAG